MGQFVGGKTRGAGVGPWERTEADLTFDRQAGLSKLYESSWPGIDLTASSLSVRSREKSFWLAIRSTVWREVTSVNVV